MTSDTLVEARGISFGYPRSTAPTFTGFDLAVAPGELIAIHGPSGSGKSTLLYLLGLFLRPSGGTLLFDGRDTVAMTDAERSLVRAHDVGFVLQDSALHLDWTLAENVAEGSVYSGVGLREATTMAYALLDEYGVGDLADCRPPQVSGGQAQRAALCRALIRKPRVVLADEPTGNLDPANARAVLEGLTRSASAGIGVVIVTHSDEVIRTADRVVPL